MHERVNNKVKKYIGKGILPELSSTSEKERIMKEKLLLTASDTELIYIYA